MFEWDENKRRLTIAKHLIDFSDAIEVLANEPLILPARSDVEARYIAVGPLDGTLIAVVFTMRRQTYRLIRARRARQDEQDQYQNLHLGRGPQA
ncbi:MAG: BrnT family toxin [Marivita sp.]|uniref:BrnT family toxin n=1 Tax=Marivita sp. TaxID=2003365 RepID=UPI001B014243|nr:BrnT family toxin [Marivita sp.]